MATFFKKIYKKFFTSKKAKVLSQWQIKPLDKSHLKFLALQHFFDITPPNSDVLEIGVGGGNGMKLLAKLTYLNKRNYFAFDSFEGFPDGSKEDNFFKSKDRWFFKYFDQEYIINQLKNIGINENELKNISFIKGYLPDTLKNYQGKPGLVYLDVDLYQSYLDCLKEIYPRLIKNGIILCDEYDTKKDLERWPGAKKAIDEFVKENSVELNRHWTGKVYLRKK